MSNNISVRLKDENIIKVDNIMKSTGMNRSECINTAIENVPIISLGSNKNIATDFHKIRLLLEQNSCSEELKQEVNQLCQSLNLLMEKINQFRK